MRLEALAAGVSPGRLLFPLLAGFEPSDILATLAAIRWVLSSATRYSVDETVLNNELQQMGLPKENSDGLSRPYRIHRDRLQAQALEDALRLPRLVSLAWRTDAVLYDSAVGDMRGASQPSSSATGRAAGAKPVASAPLPVHRLHLGLSHTLSGAYPCFPAAGAAESALLIGHRGAAGGITSSWPPSSVAAEVAPLLAAGVRPLFPSLAGRTPSPAPQAQLELSASHTQLRALLAELGAARGALTALASALPPPSLT